MNPKFSICIFTYNRAHFLSKSINSALNQVYQNYEIVIVDDGSTDNTEDVVKSFNSDKIKYIKKEHSGAPKTRNRAIKEAVGDFIVWLADDDMLLPSALQYYYLYLQKIPNIDVLYSKIRMFKDNEADAIIIDAEDWHNRNKEALSYLIKGSPITDGGCAVRKNVYSEIGTYNEEFSRAQDYEFWARVIQEQKYILKLVPKHLYLYRIHNSNITGEFSDNTDFSFEIKILQTLLKNNPLKALFPELNWDTERNEAKFEALYFLTLKFFYLKSVELGIEYLQKIKEIRELSSNETTKLESILEKISPLARIKVLKILKNREDAIITKYNKVIEEVNNGNLSNAKNLLLSIHQEIIDNNEKEFPFDKSDIELLLGRILLAEQNYDEAKEYFELVLKAKPESSEACQGLGEIFLAIEEYEAAKTMFEWSINNNIGNRVALEKLIRINTILDLPENHNSLTISEEK